MDEQRTTWPSKGQALRRQTLAGTNTTTDVICLVACSWKKIRRESLLRVGLSLGGSMFTQCQTADWDEEGRKHICCEARCGCLCMCGPGGRL